MNTKKVIFLSALAFGLLIAIALIARVSLAPSSDAEEKGAEHSSSISISDKSAQMYTSDENAFIRVAQDVGLAVVSISTEHITKMRGGLYGTPYGNDNFYDRFFNDFFGDIPEREFRQRGLGSGVIIDQSGYILTNEHVIRNADKITVTLTDGREFEGELCGKDERSDLAIIKIESSNLPAAKLGDSDKARIGQWAIAIGNPFGYAIASAKPTVTVGVVSAVDRSLPAAIGRGRDYSGLIQTDAAINPGNSGGPLVDINGEVIGINVAIFSTSGGYQGIGFAIPINAAKEILKTLIEGKKVLYGWLGVSVQDIDATLADYFDFPDEEGVIVVRVLPDSPAEKGGLKEEDVIRRLDGAKVKDLKALLDIVGQASVGKSVVVGVIRDGKGIPVTIKIGDRPSGIAGEEDKAEAEELWRGIEAMKITPDIARRYRIEDKNGLIVSNVEIDSVADKAGIITGDIIVKINDKNINNMDDYRNIVSNVSGDVLVKTDRGYSVIKAPKED
ncbi:MAG: Do family serine endopeptidase [Candidatus Orphnella occulta]|nr:Do family serine endopeptidase [Candidatus Orphnella occulta]